MGVLLETIIIVMIGIYCVNTYEKIKEEKRKIDKEKEEVEKLELEKLKIERDKEIKKQIYEKSIRVYQENHDKYVAYEKNILPPIKEKIIGYFIKYPLLIEIYYNIVASKEKFDFKVEKMDVPDKLWKKSMDDVKIETKGLPDILYDKRIDQKKRDLYSELDYYKEKGEEFLKINRRFKILFWDFLLSYEDLEKGCFEIYKSYILLKYYKLFEYYGAVDNEAYKVSELGLDFFKTESKDFLKNSYDYIDGDGYVGYYVSSYIHAVYKYAFFVNTIMDTYKEIEANDDLIQIYHNLKNGECDKYYIHKKIYSLYKELYEKDQNKTLSENDIEYMLLLEDKNESFKNQRNKVNMNNKKIKSKKQLIETISNNINGKESVGSLIQNIADVLQKQKDIEEDIKIDIIQNIDEIIRELNKIVQVKNQEIEKVKKRKETEARKKEAEKERDRLLSGDLSKENKIKKEKEELALDTSNIVNGFEFEKYVANLYKKLGYIIEQVTKKSGDQGADVVATKNDTKYVIQAKFYSNPVGNKAVQEVVAALAMYKADKGIVITNNRFTQSAIKLAGANNIELVDGKKIEEYKKQILSKI